MRKNGYPALIGAFLLLSAFTTFHSVNWKIADGYVIKFTSDNPSGVFTKLTGTVSFDPNNLATSKFEVSVDAASINTGNGMKNRHAKGEKWLDVEKYPAINFTSNQFSKKESGYEVTGTLDLHGVRKAITIPFTFTNNVFAGSFTVNRLDYNLGTNKGMAAKASTDLKIDLSVPVLNP